MKKVTIVAMCDAMASTIIGPMDVFYQAGVTWNHLNGQEVTPYFEVKVVTPTGEPFKCLNGVRMLPDGSLHDVPDTDLIVVSSILDIEQILRVQSADTARDRLPGDARRDAVPANVLRAVIQRVQRAGRPIREIHPQDLAHPSIAITHQILLYLSPYTCACSHSRQ